MSHSVRVYDPPMCCSTGVCGPSVDPNLVRIARDLNWLRTQGIDVERYNLAHEPEAFVDDPCVVEALTRDPDALPLTLIDGKIVARGAYPSRADLCAPLGIEPPDETLGLRVIG